MTMRIIRGVPAVGKPRKITCTGCGKRASEAGIAVHPDAVEEGYGAVCDEQTCAEMGLRTGRMTMIDDDDAHPLCEACCSAMEQGNSVALHN